MKLKIQTTYFQGNRFHLFPLPSTTWEMLQRYKSLTGQTYLQAINALLLAGLKPFEVDMAEFFHKRKVAEGEKLAEESKTFEVED